MLNQFLKYFYINYQFNLKFFYINYLIQVYLLNHYKNLI